MDTTIKPIPFWGDSPTILMDGKYNFFPTNKMDLNEKYNAITRLIIIFSILGFLLTFSIRFLVVSIFTFLMIYFYYYQFVLPEINANVPEAFTQPSDVVMSMMAENGIQELPPKGVFDEITPSNPFSNVLLTDYDFNPNKKPAEPAFNGNIIQDINANTKKMVQELNPTIVNLEDKLYKSLGDQLTFEQSQQRFLSNPSTTIPNDQNAFAEFCYGSMKSCKEGNPFACANNLARHPL